MKINVKSVITAMLDAEIEHTEYTQAKNEIRRAVAEAAIQDVLIQLQDIFDRVEFE